MKLNDLNILVTGIGSELSFSVLKAINLMKERPHVTGCDIYDHVAGKLWVDSFAQVPQAKDKEAYLNAVDKIIRKNNIKTIIPTTDSEIDLFSSRKAEFRHKYGCELLVNSSDVMNIFNDKWNAYKWYRENAIGTPETYNISDGIPEKLLSDKKIYPMIIKPRFGGGSRHLYQVTNPEELKIYKKIVPKPIVQEIIGSRECEYTAGTYKAKGGEVYVIILKRDLKFGMTNKAEVVFSDELDFFCKDTIRKTDLQGANNIQFRVHNGKPKIFEINPRFSGTTGIRAYFGFNELLMWLTELYIGDIAPPEVKKGKVVRFMEELYAE